MLARATVSRKKHFQRETNSKVFSIINVINISSLSWTLQLFDRNSPVSAEIDFVWCGLIVFQRKNCKESLFQKKVSQTSQNVRAVNFIRATDK